MSFLFRNFESRRCDDNQQITVSHFGEHKRLHLESSKQNYYIISLRATIKAIFTSLIENYNWMSHGCKGYPGGPPWKTPIFPAFYHPLKFKKWTLGVTRTEGVTRRVCLWHLKASFQSVLIKPNAQHDRHEGKTLLACHDLNKYSVILMLVFDTTTRERAQSNLPFAFHVTRPLFLCRSVVSVSPSVALSPRISNVVL